MLKQKVGEVDSDNCWGPSFDLKLLEQNRSTFRFAMYGTSDGVAFHALFRREKNALIHGPAWPPPKKKDARNKKEKRAKNFTHALSDSD